MAKRCPNGSRKNKSGKCVKKDGSVLGSPNTARKTKRCPKGTRRNKKSMQCVSMRKKSVSRRSSPISSIQFKSPIKMSSSVNSADFFTPPEMRRGRVGYNT